MSIHVPEWPDFESAQRASRTKAAISAVPKKVRLHGAGLLLNRNGVLVDIVKPAGGDAFAVYHSAQGLKIPPVQYKPTTKEVDEVRAWKAF